MERRLASEDDEGLDDTESDSDSVGSAWMGWGNSAAGAWEDAEEGYADLEGESGSEGEVEGESDVDVGYMGWA